MSGITLMFIGREAGAFAFTISSNQTNANLATLATAAGWNGTTALNATINSGVYISSNSTGTPALTVSGSFPNGVTLTNNGNIYGMGGNGGAGKRDNYGQSQQALLNGGVGSNGGLALSVSSAITITNNGVIGGGGGGGGGGGAGVIGPSSGGGGGQSSFAANSTGGAGGVGASSGFTTGYTAPSGGNGTYTGAGAGGVPSAFTPCGFYYKGGNGGNGGSLGASGSTGQTASVPSGDAYGTGGAGGSGGGAVSGNSNITWLVTGTRYGSIS